MSRPHLVTVVAALASALVLALDERLEWPWLVLGWVALVPWLAALDRTRSMKEALRAGLLMSVAFTVVTFSWFARSIQAYTGAPWLLALVFMGLLAPVLEPQFITVALVRHLAGRRAGGAMAFWRTALISACIYAGTDAVWPKLFGDTLGYGLYPSVWMRQAADVAGVPGLTFILVIANECVLQVIRAVGNPLLTSPVAGSGNRGGTLISRGSSSARAALAPAGFVAASVVALLAYGAVRYQEFRGGARPGETVTAGLVQADISQYNRMAAEIGTFEAVRRILDAHFALSAEVMRRDTLDFLVWPETVYPTTFGSPKSADGAAFDREIGGFVTHAGVPLVFGSYDVEGSDEFNAAFFLEPAKDGKVTFDTYRKASLFPLTERVPAVFESNLVRAWLPWLGTWKPGTGTKVLPLTLHGGRTILVAPLICYDAVDPSLVIAAVRRGAELIVTVSNDVWFGYGPAPWGHLVYAAFRSIETRRPQVRATNTGMSAVITATGEFLATAGVHERATLVGTVTPERHATTLMVVWGNWFGPTVLLCGIGLLAVPLMIGATRNSGRRTSARKPRARQRRRT